MKKIGKITDDDQIQQAEPPQWLFLNFCVYDKICIVYFICLHF